MLMWPGESAKDSYSHLPFNVQPDEEGVVLAWQIIRTVIRGNLEDVTEIFTLYRPFLWLLTEARRLDGWLKGGPTLDACNALIAAYRRSQADAKASLPVEIALDLFLIRCESMNKEIDRAAEGCVHLILQYVESECVSLASRASSRFKDLSSILLARPSNSSELVAAELYLDTAQEKEAVAVRESADAAKQRLDFLFRHSHRISPRLLRPIYSAFVCVRKLPEVLDNATSLIMATRGTQETQLREMRESVVKEMAVLSKRIETFKDRGTMSEAKNNCKELTAIKKLLAATEATVDEVHEEEQLLGWSQSNFAQVAANRQLMAPFYTLWFLAEDVKKNEKRWLTGPVFLLDINEVEEEVDRMHRSANTLSRALADVAPPAAEVARKLLGRVVKLKKHLPLLEVLCNRGMKARHWKEVRICSHEGGMVLMSLLYTHTKRCLFD